MKYPFTPDVLENIPKELESIYLSLESKVLYEICNQLKKLGELNESSVQKLRSLRAAGISQKNIEIALQKTANLSATAVKKILTDVVTQNQQYYGGTATLAGITTPSKFIDASFIEAIEAQTLGEFTNITRSLGFVVNNGMTMLSPAQAYQWALDKAVLEIDGEAFSYNEAIKSAVSELTNSGLMPYVIDPKTGAPYPVVEYSKNKVSLDSAVRRAVMTGVSQLCDKFTEQGAKQLGTAYFEISAHVGARDKDGPNGWENHKKWQGKVYYQSIAGEPDPLGKYPDLHDATGFGEVDGLEGANCRHRRFPWIEGVSERTYTNQELQNIDVGHDCTYQGKHYSAYEATQNQRRLERAIRQAKRRYEAFKAAGLDKETQNEKIRLQRLKYEYKAFSSVAKLPEQPARYRVP